MRRSRVITSRMIGCVDGDDLPIAGRAGERQPKMLVPQTACST